MFHDNVSHVIINGDKMLEKNKENKKIETSCNTYKSGGYYGTISIHGFD